MTDYSDLQKRCQRGCVALSNANNLLAECYAAIGALIAENDSLRKDAERWRFIRDEWPKVKLAPNGDWFNSCFLEREIDAVMSKGA